MSPHVPHFLEKWDSDSSLPLRTRRLSSVGFIRVWPHWRASCRTQSLSLFPSSKSKKIIQAREFYHYLQIRHFFQTHYARVPWDSHTFFEYLCQTAPRQKGLISGLYKSLELVGDDPLLKYRSQLEQELNLHNEDLDWEANWQNMRKCTKSLMVKETAIKLFTRWYYTPSHLGKIFP